MASRCSRCPARQGAPSPLMMLQYTGACIPRRRRIMLHRETDIHPCQKYIRPTGFTTNRAEFPGFPSGSIDQLFRLPEAVDSTEINHSTAPSQGGSSTHSTHRTPHTAPKQNTTSQTIASSTSRRRAMENGTSQDSPVELHSLSTLARIHDPMRHASSHRSRPPARSRRRAPCGRS